MIAICGLPTTPLGGKDNDLVETAFQAFRNKDQRDKVTGWLGWVRHG
jgi:hypothetical protein